MEKIKKGAGFFYLSLVIHLYLILIIGIAFDRNFLESMLYPLRNLAEERESEPTIVDTETESTVTPLKGMVSDKPNQNAGKQGVEENYNYLNPNNNRPENSKTSRTSGPARDKNDETGKDSISVDILKGQKIQSMDSGDYHTSLFNPYMPADVTMNNAGDISLATIPEPYAAYFLNMEKKIGENWQQFFPIFQYFNGIIKSGDVVVTFWIDEQGNVLNPAVIKSYGYTSLDEACLNAVSYSKNFGPLPESIRKNKYIKIDFTFIYTSLK